MNVDLLLEKIILEAELLDLKANPDRLTRGVVVEAELDKGRGITGTILVQKGTLRIGDPFVAGIHHGKVRAMFDERGNKVKEAPPSTPVLVLGFEGAPQAGDTFIVLESEREAREISLKRQQLKREQDQKQIHHITLDEIAKQISIGGVKELALIVKGDVDGSVEALSDSLMKLSQPGSYCYALFIKVLEEFLKVMFFLLLHPMQLLLVSMFVQISMQENLQKIKKLILGFTVLFTMQSTKLNQLLKDYYLQLFLKK